MKKSSKILACRVLAVLCACGISPFFISQAVAADPVSVTDTTNTAWRSTDGSYTFSNGLNFTFDGTAHPDGLQGGISVDAESDNAERVLNAAGDLSITHQNGQGTQQSGRSSAGAYVYDNRSGSNMTPSQVTFTGGNIHLTGLFNGDSVTSRNPANTYGLYVHGNSRTYAADETNARVNFNNANTYLNASYQSEQRPLGTVHADALDVDHAAEAVFNGNAYLTTTINEHGDINGTAVNAFTGKAIFNGNETRLDVTSQNTESNNRTIYGVYVQGPYTGRVQATPYEQVRFNSPTTGIRVTSNGRSGAFGVYNQIGDVNFTDNVRNLSIDVDARGEGGNPYRVVSGLQAWNHGTINNHAGNTRITSHTDDPSIPFSSNNALRVEENGHINMDGSRLDIQADNENSDVIAVFAYGARSYLRPQNDAVRLTTGNTIHLNADNMTITAAGQNGQPSYAVYALGYDNPATININSDDAGNDQGKTLQVTGHVMSIGGTSENADALVNMNFTNSDSFLRGQSRYINQTAPGTLNFKFNNGATWDMTGNSSVTNLTMNNGGIVDMRADNNGYSTLRANTLSGNGGTIRENIDVRSMQADRVYVPGNFTGNQSLDIYQQDNYVPAANTTEGNGLVLATVNGNGTFTARDREGTLFYTVYDLAQKDSDTNGYRTDWYLNRIYHANPEDRPTPTVEESTASYGLAYYTWRQDIDKLLQRMGELRHNGEEVNGFWARVKGSKIGRDGRFGFKNRYRHYELGYDKVAKRTKDLTRYQGVSFSYVDGDGNYHNGSGSDHGGALAFYNTDIRSKGHYLDLVLKVGRYKTNYTTHTGSGERVHGDFNNTGVALSAEYGRKKSLSDNGWYIEPQAQLTFGYFDGDNYRTSNGVHVHQNGIKTAIGRIGFNLGKDLGAKSKVYLKANLYHDFGGHGAITMTDPEGRVHLDQDYGDTWFMYGIGTAFQMGKDSHFYCDFERSTGTKFHTNWQWNVGMRFNF